MPSIFSKLLENPIKYIPPKWALFFMKLTTAQKYSIIVALVGLTAYLSRRKNGTQRSKNTFGASVNKDFFKQMKYLLNIMIPSLGSPQALMIMMHTAVLSAKTFLSIYVATLEGSIIKEIVSRNVSDFFALLLKWFIIAIPACFLNSSMRYLEKQLALSFRTRLVQHAYNSYFDNQVYYRVGNLDTRLQNPDHSLTEDISTFANSVAHLYSHIMKPTLDAFLISFTLVRRARSIGGNPLPGALICSAVIFLTSEILKKMSPKFGQLAAKEAELKAKLRHCHSRIVTNSEEIAFYGGDIIEKKTLIDAYRSETTQSKKIYLAKLWYVVIEQYLMKYFWAGTGMLLIAIPILTGDYQVIPGITKNFHSYVNGKNQNLKFRAFLKLQKKIILPKKASSAQHVAKRFRVFYDGVFEKKYYVKKLDDHLAGFAPKGFDKGAGAATRTQYYMTTKNLLMTGSDATERLFSSYKEIVELAGYSARVSNIFTVFNEVSKGKYVRESCESQKKLDYGIVMENSNSVIELKDIKVVTPNGDIIVPDLNLLMKPGMHLLITGPNGCGKSSLFRILSGLWPVYGGTLSRPPVSSLYYIPQRPYMSLGNLREQVIYPDSHASMLRKGIKDGDLSDILEKVRLNHIVIREGGWDSVRDWQDVLSGGEKQRVGLARLFYHQPSFALLDECTSAVSMDVEDLIYSMLASSGINLLTISHRPSLFKHHTHVLRFYGDGKWSFAEMDLSKELNSGGEK